MTPQPDVAGRPPSPELAERAKRIKLILFDVDGVLTDGTLLLHADGTESKRFDIKDGTGIVLAQRAGIRVGFLSARLSAATQQRAAQLGVTLVHQGIASKLETYEQITDELLLDDDEIDLRATSVTKVMTQRPKTIAQESLAVEAARIMEDHKIHALLVVDDQQRLVGALNSHDLLRARVV